MKTIKKKKLFLLKCCDNYDIKSVKIYGLLESFLYHCMCTCNTVFPA